MKSLFRAAGAALIASTFVALHGSPASGAERTTATSPCDATERWRLESAIPADARAEFGEFLAGRSSAAKSFSDALAYRRDTPGGSPRLFSEYWVARTLFSSGLAHQAFAGFQVIASQAATPETAGVQIAALACVNRLRQEHPGLELSSTTADTLRRLKEHASTAQEERTLQLSGVLLILQDLELHRPQEEVSRLLPILRSSETHFTFANALIAAASARPAQASSQLERFFALQGDARTRVPELERYHDQAHLLAAQAHYSAHRYAQAVAHLKAVRRASNDLPESLSELAWASLMTRNFSEAIGAALGVQAGSLRRTFAPEASMVLAMAMNELCQYPESLRAVNQFRKSYEPSYRWLSEWIKHPQGANLHAATLAYLKRKGGAPDRVASEWIRSPVFVSSQDELNLTLDEAAAVTRMNQLGAREQKSLGHSLRSSSTPLIRRLREERGQPLSPSLKRDVENIVALIGRYRRYTAAAGPWRALVANQSAFASGIRGRNIARVNSELARLNRLMHAKLEEIAENNRLIEIEIFDGASRDIIWQHAHPDYREVAQRLQDEGQAVASSKVWRWGQAPIDSDAWSEVWEDELGSFQSNLFDNCSSKDKYLTIRKLS